MLNRGSPILDALERWKSKGLVTPEQSELLAEEAEQHLQKRGRHLSQYVLAAAGAVVLLIATAVLGDWLWPLLGVGARALILGALGVAVHFLGLFMERRRRWLPAAYFLQAAGLLVLLGAMVYSGDRWPRSTVIGKLIGVAALAVPFIVVPRTLGQNAFMPAVHLPLGLGFVALALDRTLELTTGQVIWALDALLALILIILILELSRAREPDRVRWRLALFTTGIYTGGVLAFATAVEPLDLKTDTLWVLDGWLLVVAMLTLAGIHWVPSHLRRNWYEFQLAVCVLFGVPLTFGTCLELLHWSDAWTALVLGLIGAAGLAYGLIQDAAAPLRAGALCIVVAAWYFGVTQAGALGAVAALGFTAALLFWLSVRVGGDRDPVSVPGTPSNPSKSK